MSNQPFKLNKFALEKLILDSPFMSYDEPSLHISYY